MRVIRDLLGAGADAPLPPLPPPLPACDDGPRRATVSLEKDQRARDEAMWGLINDLDREADERIRAQERLRARVVVERLRAQVSLQNREEE